MSEEKDMKKEFNNRIKSLKLSEKEKEELFAKFVKALKNGFTCEYCNNKMDLKYESEYGWTIDHIIPKIKNGKDEPSNLKFVCRDCNLLKGDMDAQKYLENMKRLKARKTKREYRKARKSSKKDEQTREAYKDIFLMVAAKNV